MKCLTVVSQTACPAERLENWVSPCGPGCLGRCLGNAEEHRADGDWYQVTQAKQFFPSSFTAALAIDCMVE